MAAEQLQDIDTTAAAANDNDDVNDNNAGGDTSESEIRVKLSSDVGPIDSSGASWQEVDATERQSAELYVSRLSRFLASSLLHSTTMSPLDADKLLQDFSSKFCTGITLTVPDDRSLLYKM